MRSTILAAVALCVLSATANASTWCYPDLSACPSGVSGTATANVETAAQTNRSDGVADTIYLKASSTYADSDTLAPTGSDPLTIEGAGVTSVLTTSASGNIYVVNTSSAANTVTFKNLRLIVPASLTDNAGAGMQLTGDVLDGVDIDVQNPGSTGIAAVDANSIQRTHIYASAGGAVGYAIDVNKVAGNATVTVADTQIDAPSIGIINDTATDQLDVQRTTVADPGQAAFSATQGGQATIHNSVVKISGSAAALSTSASVGSSSSLVADHLTAVKTGGADAPALRALVPNLDGTGSASVTVSTSILRGFATTWQRNAPTGATKGDASIALDHSDFVAVGSDAGDGATTLGAGNIDADPLFVSATDFHLSPCSPALGMGAYDPPSDPCPPPPADPAPGGGGTSDPAPADPGPAPVPAPGPGTTTLDTSAPVLTGLARRAGGLAFALSEPATVTIRLANRRVGRRVSGHCRKTTRANRRHRHCYRWVARKPLSGVYATGSVHAALAKLPRGVWRAVLVASDAAGNRSQATRIVFRVRR